MKLLEITIHNFRGIIHQTMFLQRYSLLVGANNAGKSTVIDAIRCFYEKDRFKFKKEHDFPLKGAPDNESWVELLFSLTDPEFDSLAEEYQASSKQLKVRKHFQTDQNLHNGKSANGAILGYKGDGTLDSKPFYGAKNVQSGKFGDLIYIPAVSKVDEHTKLSGPSALRDLITNIMSDVVESSEEYTKLTQSVQSFADGVKSIETNDKRSLSGFESDLNSLLTPWETEFNLKFNSPSTAEIIKSMLGWDIKDNNHEQSQGIEYFGSGFQRHFIYSLINLGASYVPKKTGKKSKDFTPSLNLVLFEEPEAFLHPPQQEELARNLISVGESEDWQIMCSTHSAHFVSRNSRRIPAIARLQRNNGIVQIFQINEDDLNKVFDANQTISLIADKYPKVKKKMEEDDLKPEMESIKYFLWLNTDRSSLFFANSILLVEGPSETALINKLIDDGKIRLPLGVHILDCLGKYNVHRVINLLSAFGICHSVLHDGDNDQGEHKELNQLIVDSKNERITQEIKKFDNTLEDFISIPKTGSPHRKPQHILYCYANGKITEEKLDSLCSLVESCFPET